MIRGLAVLLAFQLAGDLLGHLLPWPLPGSVVGMGLLTLSLRLRLVSSDIVRPVATALTRHMAFFFVPAGVGVAAYADLVRREAVPIVVASMVSTFTVMALVGRLASQPRTEGP